MDSLAAFWQVLMGICAGVVALGGAQAVVGRLFRPGRDLFVTVEEHERELEVQKAAIAELVEGQRIENRCMLQLLNHLIDGNHVEQLKSERDALQTYLIER